MIAKCLDKDCPARNECLHFLKGKGKAKGYRHDRMACANFLDKNDYKLKLHTMNKPKGWDY